MPYKVLTPDRRKRANEANSRWKDRNREKVLEYKRTHYRNNREKYVTLERDRQYRVRYGITLSDYDRMDAEQGGTCAICAATESGKVGQFFAVDHDHATGKVRGLLCIRCNSRLGWFEKYSAQVHKYLGDENA
jgi:hypothetical protein